MLDAWQILVDGFRFDAWANGLWLDCLRKKGNSEPDLEIFQHLLSAQATWLLRCQGSPPNAPPAFPVTEEKMESLSAEWIHLLEVQSGDSPVIAYHRYSGEPNQLPLDQIARHVIDHGTYHRGEIRGLFLSRGDDDFPETGLVGYYLSLG